MKRYVNREHAERLKRIEDYLAQVNELLEGTDITFEDLYLLYIDHKKSNRVVDVHHDDL